MIKPYNMKASDGDTAYSHNYGANSSNLGVSFNSPR